MNGQQQVIANLSLFTSSGFERSGEGEEELQELEYIVAPKKRKRNKECVPKRMTKKSNSGKKPSQWAQLQQDLLRLANSSEKRIRKPSALSCDSLYSN
jgi:hypothetical protein